MGYEAVVPCLLLIVWVALTKNFPQNTSKRCSTASYKTNELDACIMEEGVCDIVCPGIARFGVRKSAVPVTPVLPETNFFIAS